MIGPEPVIAIAGSQRAWASELRRFLTDFGGARLKGTVLTAREALETGYELLLIDDIASYLSPRLVERLRERGARIKSVAEGRSIETVCGYNFVAPFDEWMPRFETLLAA